MTDVGFERQGESRRHARGRPTGKGSGGVVLVAVLVWLRVGGGWVRPAGSLLQRVSPPPPGNLELLPRDWFPGQSCYPLWRETTTGQTCQTFAAAAALVYRQ